MQINTHTETWACVRKHCDERLDSLRTKLEGDISFDESIKIRAQIRELRGIISLGEVEAPLVDAPDTLPE